MRIYFDSDSKSNAEKYQKLKEHDHLLGSAIDAMRFDEVYTLAQNSNVFKNVVIHMQCFLRTRVTCH
jgi:hypothetical protein